MTVTISHSAGSGTLLDGTVKGDGTNAVIKAYGWRWSGSLGSWYLPRSRDVVPKVGAIERTAVALRGAGYLVDVLIDAAVRPTREVEADRVERQTRRVEALEVNAVRRESAADAAGERDRRMTELLPPGGEPIKIGHHSEARHRRAIERSHRSADAAVAAREQAREASRRAVTAAGTTGGRYSPVTVANRIDKLEAEQRGDQRKLDGHVRTVYVDNQGGRHCESTAAVAGEVRDRIGTRMADRADQITYWKGIRDEQISTGEATNYGPATITKGDQVCWRGTWYLVRRVNKKTVTIPSIVGGSWTDTMPYHEIQGHRSAED